MGMNSEWTAENNAEIVELLKERRGVEERHGERHPQTLKSYADQIGVSFQFLGKVLSGEQRNVGPKIADFLGYKLQIRYVEKDGNEPYIDGVARKMIARAKAGLKKRPQAKATAKPPRKPRKLAKASKRTTKKAKAKK